MSNFAENRKFFLEIIDDMAKGEVAFTKAMDVPPEQWEREAREDKAWTEAVADVEQGRTGPDEEREHSPEWFREQIEKNSDRELLLHRRFTAKLICESVADVGHLHIQVMHEALLGAIERLRIMDVEVSRRHLDRDQTPAE